MSTHAAARARARRKSEWGDVGKGLFFLSPWMFGYLVFFLLVAFAVTARRSRHVQPQVRNGAYLLSGLGIAQVILGIATVMTVAPLALSIAHQILATLLLGVSVWLTWRARRL